LNAVKAFEEALDLSHPGSKFRTDARLAAVQRYEPVGPAHVLVTLRQTARLRGSDQQLTELIYMLWHLVEGRAQETWTSSVREQALKAGGLLE
jgi:hypothetical protein